jgi:hypothetical protein
VAAVVAAVIAVAVVVAVAVIVTIGAAVIEEEVAAGGILTTGRFSSFSTNPWILKVRPFTVGSLYTS